MQFLGFHLDRHHFQLALIDKNRKGVEIRTLKMVPFSEAESVKRLYSKNFRGKVAIGLSPKDFLIRSLELKIGKSRHTEEAIAFQSETTNHLNPEEILTIPLLKKREGGATEATLFNASRPAIKNHLLELEKIGIEPDQLTSTCCALCHFIRWKIPKLESVFIIDLGFNEWTCVWMEKGELKKSYSIPGGIEALLTELWEDRKKILLQKEIEGVAKQIDLLQLKSHFNPNLSAKLNELRQHLAKIIFSFHRLADSRPVIFTGRVDAFSHLKEFLGESFKEVISTEHQGSLTLDEQKYAIAIGLALELTSPHSLQFLKRDFYPKKQWRRLGLFSMGLVLTSLLLTVGLLILGTYHQKIRKSQMVASLRLSLEESSPIFKGKIFADADQDETLERWIHTVETQNKPYVYIPQSPKVAEVFQWLSSHPLIELFKKEGDPLVIREIRYQLVQFPKIGSSKEPYLAKVELEFEVKGAIYARKFHEALLKGDHYVDPHLEITWEALSHSYRTSFYLKNRSSHVF
jgi:type IV pilus assembly protein PilM